MSSTETDVSIALTELAVSKVREVLEQQGLTAEESNLRVYVAGGSCCGPTFGLAFDSARDDDVKVEADGLNVLIDPMSLPHVKGATIDFVDTAEVQGFRVTVPNADMGCSPGDCGPGACPS
jgi:iron-sulfur cluster assembly accessory protein